MSLRLALAAPLAAMLHLAACDTGPTPRAGQCQSDRQCQDGDLCNGAEVCLDGACAPGRPTTCPAVSPGPCGATCAEDEACHAGRCEPQCVPPQLPAFAVVPLGTRLAAPPGAHLASADGPLAPASTLVLDRPGPVAVEARWDEPLGCERPFAHTYEVVAALEADPALAADAVAMDDPRIVAWAEGYRDLEPGADLDPAWADPTRALGPALGTWDDALSLGNGGRVTLSFAVPFGDGDGPDLAVFENGFSELFLELAFVEVSSNGVDFVRFPAQARQSGPVAAYGTLDPREVQGLAGRFRAGIGQAFDLATLSQTTEVLTGRVDLAAIAFVRLVDLIGDGSSRDAFGAPLYDPTPTTGPAGFDVDGVAALGPTPR